MILVSIKVKISSQAKTTASYSSIKESKNKNCKLSHNVPAVCDVFVVAIKETVGFQQPQKCGGEKPHKGGL